MTCSLKSSCLTANLLLNLQVEVSRAVVHSEEQEDGDMRPDLDLELHVSQVQVC